jgi:hypothetical protein
MRGIFQRQLAEYANYWVPARSCHALAKIIRIIAIAANLIGAMMRQALVTGGGGFIGQHNIW